MAKSKEPTKLTNRKLAKQHGFIGANLGVGMAFVKEFETEIAGKKQTLEISISVSCDCSSHLPKLDDYVNIYLCTIDTGCCMIVNGRSDLASALDFADKMQAKVQAEGVEAAKNEFGIEEERTRRIAADNARFDAQFDLHA